MKAFDLQRMAFDKVPPEFLGEVALRSLYTFVLVFLFLKITGRRGVRQMSLFEVLIILTLGSAAGDVAFYDDVPMVPVFIVFVSLALLYRLVMWLMSKSEKLEDLLEGKPVVIVEDGQLAWENVQSANMTEFEFFMELRLNSVEQLGQVVKRCYEEGIPMTVRGSGTYLTGGTIPDCSDTIVILTTGLNKILEINTEDLYATVQPGVITAKFAAAVAALPLRAKFSGHEPPV